MRTESENWSVKTKSNGERMFPREELLVVAIYLVFGCSWIILSDAALDRYIGDPLDTLELQTYKGLNFIFTTAFLLYLVLRRSFIRRRRAERQEQHATRRFELVARASNDAIFDWDILAEKIWWSEGLKSLFGYPVEISHVGGGEWSKRFHPEDRTRVETGLRQAVTDAGSAWSDEFRFQRCDGTYAIVSGRGHVMRDSSGNPLRMVGGLTDITARREAEQKLELSRRQLRALSARVESMREEERSRISREIHDELGQCLTGLKMDLRWIERRLSDVNHPAVNPVLDRIIEASELADSTITTVQNIATELRPGILDSLGLAAAVTQEAGRFEQRTGIPCRAVVPEHSLPFSREVSTAAFRILQEALTNISRHANATRVNVALREEGERFVLEICDDGRGLRESDLANPRSLGLLGMQERAALIGAGVHFASRGQGGTCVTLRIPPHPQDTKFWELL